MVEVIHRGQLPADMVYNVGCRHCGSQLRFKRYEATFCPDQRDGDYLSIECPVCSSTVTAQARKPYPQPGGWKD